MALKYTVKSGDTLSKIGALYNASWQDIMQWSGLTSTLIPVGQVVTVSNPGLDRPDENKAYSVQAYLRKQ